MSHKVERSFFLFKILFQFFFALSFPTYVLFLKEGGMAPSEIGIVNTMFLFAVCLFEVPTGIVGDRFGRKKSIIIGLFISSLGFLSYFLSHSLWMYVASETILALGMSFISGSLQAWLKDTLDHYRGQNKFGVVWSNGEKFAHLAGIVGGAIGALLGTIMLSLTWLVASVGVFGLAILCFSLVDESYFKHTQMTWTESWHEASRLFKTGFKFAYTKKEVRYFFICSCLTAFSLQPLNQQWSLYSEQAFGLEAILYVWIAMAFCMFLGSHSVSLVLKRGRISEAALLFITQLLTTVFVLIMAQQTSPWLVLMFFGLHEIPRGSWNSLSESYLQHQVPSEIRATMGSISSLMIKLGAGVGWFLSGILLESVPILNCWFFSGLSLALTLPFFYLLWKSQRYLSA